MTKNILGFIGGSGVYDIDFIDNKKYIDVKSSWGKTSDKIIEGKLNKNNIYFLSRHGKGHKLSPTSINYRANIEALKQCGVTDIYSLSAVGSLKKSLTPGTFVIIDQFIDRTISRNNSFFNEGIVAHVPMAKPTNKTLMKLAKNTLDKLKIKNKYGGTYMNIEGPQFSTKSESKLYKKWGCDVIGMTNATEAKLCREIEIRYSSISMITDYDCWYDDHDDVDVEMIIQTLNKNAKISKNFIKNVCIKFYQKLYFGKDETSKILNNSIITNRKYWDKKIEKKMEFILNRYKKKR